MRQALAAGVACAITATALARDAHASDPVFALDYEAPPRCPSETSFVADVRARVADPPPDATVEQRFRIRIFEADGAYHGALETGDPPSVREVGGATCEEVVRALVVFVALALSSERPSSDTPPSTPPLPPPPPPRETTTPPAAEPPRQQPVFRPRRVPPFLGLDLRALAVTGVTPGLAFGGALAARLVLQSRPTVRWVVHAGGLVAYREEPVLRGAFDFLWTAARIDGGPAFDLGPVRISGGPALRAGVLSVGARDLPSAGEYSSFWGDVGGFARVDRALTRGVAISLVVELAVPIQRRSFGIEGIDAPIHEVGAIIGLASLGLTLGE